jgi:hypothetical protein
MHKEHLKRCATMTYPSIYNWKKLSSSADVFLWVFTSAYKRDVAVKLCKKVCPLFPPSPIFPYLLPPSALALFGNFKLLR